MSLIQLGRERAGQAQEGTARVAGLESARNNANKQLKDMAKSRTVSNVASGVGMGFALGGPMGALVGGGLGLLVDGLF